jgi:NAD(P)-dependent dehydrogenase (short-subunit alcohol dehydrogenase family)
MTVTLVTGANKGLGRQTVPRLVGLGHIVYLGARDQERGKSTAGELGANFVQLDVTDDASVDAAVAEIADRDHRLDLLINASIFEGMIALDDATPAVARRIFDVNVIGVVRVTRAFLPLPRASESPAIINVNTALGSFGVVTDPERGESHFTLPIYNTSKAALNMLTVQYAKGLPGVRVNAIEPGFSATGLHGVSGEGIHPEEELSRSSSGTVHKHRDQHSHRSARATPLVATLRWRQPGAVAASRARANPDEYPAGRTGCSPATPATVQERVCYSTCWAEA